MNPVFIQKILDDLFPNPAISLSHEDPYTLLVAVLLSAQCQDLRVNQITPLLFAKAKTPEAMTQLSIAEIEEIIRPCGLGPRKASAIYHLSHQIVRDHGGVVPATFEELEALFGIGHKSASVVMAQAFNIPAFPVDTHIHRCAKRWGLTKGKSVQETERDLKKIFPKECWNRLHLQIIYYARAHCKARGHRDDLCLICSSSKRSTK